MAWQCPLCGKVNFDDSILQCSCGAKVKNITDDDNYDNYDRWTDARVFLEEHPFIEDFFRQADETADDEPTFPPGKQVESRYDVGVDVFFAVAASFLVLTFLVAILPEDDLLTQYTLLALARCGIVWLLNRKYPLKLSELGSTRHITRFALAVAFVIIPFNVFLASEWPSVVPANYDLYLNYNSYQKLTFLLQIAMVAPVIEEIFYRGYLYRILRMRYNTYLAFIFTAIPWVVGHGFDIGVLFPALVFTAIYEKTANLWYCMITHSLWNLGVYLFVYLS